MWPLDFLMQRWREGRSDLTVIAALAGVVLVEKLLPIGPRTVRITGVFLIVLAVWVLAHGRQG